MIRRREFIAVLGGAAVAWPRAARAQQPGAMRRIGALISFAADDPEAQARLAAFVQGLQHLGWTNGRNLRTDYRWSSDDPDSARKYLPAGLRGRAESFRIAWGRLRSRFSLC
jgi:putative ABC transport system substrate-binding protein